MVLFYQGWAIYEGLSVCIEVRLQNLRTLKLGGLNVEASINGGWLRSSFKSSCKAGRVA